MDGARHGGDCGSICEHNRPTVLSRSNRRERRKRVFTVVQARKIDGAFSRHPFVSPSRMRSFRPSFHAFKRLEIALRQRIRKRPVHPQRLGLGGNGNYHWFVIEGDTIRRTRRNGRTPRSFSSTFINRDKVAHDFGAFGIAVNLNIRDRNRSAPTACQLRPAFSRPLVCRPRRGRRNNSVVYNPCDCNVVGWPWIADNGGRRHGLTTIKLCPP